MILSKKIGIQKAEVDQLYQQVQAARGRGKVAASVATPAAAPNKLGSHLKHPVKLLAWSFVLGSVAACISTRRSNESTAHAVGKVTGALKTGVAAVALAKTMGDLASSAESVAPDSSSDI